MNIDINIPEGKSGNWSIQNFEVIENDAFFFNLKASYKPGNRIIKPGKYKRLMRNRQVIMSNTSAEIRDHLSFIYRAKKIGGNILINGLGLGVCVFAILESNEIKSITVIEKEQDVINLVAPYIKDQRVIIIHSDAFRYKPPKGKRYNTVWHDIWDNICADNLPEMTKLHRKYGKRTDWQSSWCKELCKRLK